MFVWFLIGIAAFFPACSGSPTTGPDPISPTPITARGTLRAAPRDIPAALSRALTETELATTGTEEPEPGVTVYRLVDLRGQPGKLIVRFPQTPAAEPPAEAIPVPVVLSASLGRFGDERREHKLLMAMEKELRNLAREDEASTP